MRVPAPWDSLRNVGTPSALLSMPPVSWLATIVGTVLAFALGGVWYGPLFGKAWIAEQGKTQEELMQGFNPGVTYGVMLLLTFISAFVFGMFLGPKPSLALGVGAGFAAGLCWVSFSIATNYLFERRSLRAFLINGGYHTLRFALIGLAFSLLG